MRSLLIAFLGLGMVCGSKVALLSYNTAGVFRRFEKGSKEFELLRTKLASDLASRASKEAELVVFAFQEIWDVSNTISETFSLIRDVTRDSLSERVLSFTKGVMEVAYKQRKFSCLSEQNHSLMTVACKLSDFSAQSGSSWFKSAFKFGWSENGGSTSTYIFGFKGLLGTSIALDKNRQILIINLHLSSKNLEHRRKGLLSAFELAKPYIESSKFAVILAGDFNARSFSLVLQDPKKFNTYKGNIGAAFLMLCLTGAIDKSTFQLAGTPELDCPSVLAAAKKYDDIAYIFRRHYPSAKEAGQLSFEPTFCFDFHARNAPPGQLRLCPKLNEVVPSFTDRIFELPQEAHPIIWREYTSLPGGESEFSDHQAILGVFEFQGAQTAPSISPEAIIFPQIKDLPEFQSDPNPKSKSQVDFSLPARKNIKLGSKDFTFPNYKPSGKVNYNKMVKGIRVLHLVNFFYYAEFDFLNKVSLIKSSG